MGRAVGTSVRRKDGDAKVTGAAKYIDDLTFPGMLFGATIRSTIPRGEIVNTHINLSPDYIVADYRDIPGKNYVALLDPDQPCLAEREAQAALRREIAPIDGGVSSASGGESARRVLERHAMMVLKCPPARPKAAPARPRRSWLGGHQPAKTGWGAVLIVSAVCAWPAPAGAQAIADGDRVMTTVRAALAPALPFPDTDDSGTVPANGSPVPAWMVRPLQPGERSVEVMANPLNEINQARALRAMAQIGVAIDAAQRRAELQYERAVAEAKRTGRSQDVDGVGLSDEGVAGARIDAEAHVTIDVDFNQPSYTFGVESSVAPAPSRSVAIAGAVAIVMVPSNVFRVKVAHRSEEKFSPAEAVVLFGTLGPPEVRERSENAYEVVASAAAESSSPVRNMAIRLRGNELLIADILRKTDWPQVLELLK